MPKTRKVSAGEPEAQWQYTNIGLRRDQHEWLRLRAFRERTTISALIRQALDELRDREEPQRQLPL
jgi:hypothetical protein